MWQNILYLKGWWTKVGQFLSTRSDILPKPYIDYFIKLQDQMPITPRREIEKILLTDLSSESNRKLNVEYPPICSASIGQVHLATFHSGEEVVIKVQHPDADSLQISDMKNLRDICWALAKLEKTFDISTILNEWEKVGRKELDFNNESNNQELVRNAFKKSKISVKVPNVYTEFTTKRTIVMEYINGVKINDITKLKTLDVPLEKVVTKLLDSFAFQFFILGVYHGDPHPGNILVVQENDEYIPVILDWGFVKEVNKTQRLALAKLVIN